MEIGANEVHKTVKLLPAIRDIVNIKLDLTRRVPMYRTSIMIKSREIMQVGMPARLYIRPFRKQMGDLFNRLREVVRGEARKLHYIAWREY